MSSISKIRLSVSGYLRSHDVPLLIGTLFLCLAGVVNLLGIGMPDPTLAERQAFFVIIGLVLMVLFSLSDSSD